MLLRRLGVLLGVWCFSWQAMSTEAGKERVCYHGDDVYQGKYYCATNSELKAAIEAAEEGGLRCGAPMQTGGWLLDSDPYNEMQKFTLSAKKENGKRDLIPRAGWFNIIGYDVCVDYGKAIRCKFDKYSIRINLSPDEYGDIGGKISKPFAKAGRISC